jgi:hypothetical protein
MKLHRLLAAAFATVGLGSGPALARAPDLAACARPQSPENEERERKVQLPVPAPLRAIIRSNLGHYAIATQGGTTVCVDTGWMETAAWDAPDPASRFLSFRWDGHEAYGHYLIDRSGKGQAVDIGANPVFSPSRQRFAAVDQSESEFGTLSGLAVWPVRPVGLGEPAKVENIPRMADGRIDGWSGENCINLSARPLTADENARRTRYIARSTARGWSITRSAVGCPRA